MAELKPCPFCGGEAKIHSLTDIIGCYRVRCTKCPVEFGQYWFYRKADLIKAWNRRADNEN